MKFGFACLFLALTAQGCSLLNNRLDASKVVCATNSVESEDWPVKIVDSQDQLVSPDQLEVLQAGKDWQPLENIRRTPACLMFKRNLRDQIVIRRRGSTSGVIADFSQLDRSADVLNLRLDQHTYEPIRIECPASVATRERGISLPVNWGRNNPAHMLVEISQPNGSAIHIASGDQSLLDLSQVPQGASISFDIRVRPMFMDPAPQAPTRCTYRFDQQAPEPVTTIRDPYQKFHAGNFVSVGSNIDFNNSGEGSADDRYQACILPASSDAVDCSAAKITEGTLVIQSAGDFKLIYRGVDAAGNSSAWKSTVLHVIDQDKLNRIHGLLELTIAKLGTDSPKKALNPYLEALNEYFSLQTQRERDMVQGELEDGILQLHQLPKETALSDAQATNAMSYVGVVAERGAELFAFISERKDGPVLLFKDADNQDHDAIKLDARPQTVGEPCESRGSLAFIQGADFKVFTQGKLTTAFTDSRLKDSMKLSLSVDCQMATVILSDNQTLVVDLNRKLAFAVSDPCYRFVHRPIASDIQYLGHCIGPNNRVRYFDAEGKEKSEPAFMAALPKPIRQVHVDGSGILAVVDASSTLTLFADAKAIHKQNSVDTIGLVRGKSNLYSISHEGRGLFFQVSAGPVRNVTTLPDFVARSGMHHFMSNELGAAISKDSSRLIWMRPYERSEALQPSWPISGMFLEETTDTYVLLADWQRAFRLVKPYEKLFSQTILYKSVPTKKHKSLPPPYWRPHSSYIFEVNSYERFDFDSNIAFRRSNGGTRVFPFSSLNGRNCKLSGNEACIAELFDDRVDIRDFDDQHQEQRVSIALPHLKKDLELLLYENAGLGDLFDVFYDKKAGILQLSIPGWGTLTYDLDAPEAGPFPLWVDSEHANLFGKNWIDSMLPIGRKNQFVMVSSDELIFVDPFMKKTGSLLLDQIFTDGLGHGIEEVQYDQERDSIIVTSGSRMVARVHVPDLSIAILMQSVVSEEITSLTFEEPTILNSDGVRAFCYHSGLEVVRVDLNLEHARSTLQKLLGP